MWDGRLAAGSRGGGRARERCAANVYAFCELTTENFEVKRVCAILWY